MLDPSQLMVLKAYCLPIGASEGQTYEQALNHAVMSYHHIAALDGLAPAEDDEVRAALLKLDGSPQGRA